jgi:RsiW-degrading membrane proteinase PrsW (M82 family)
VLWAILIICLMAYTMQQISNAPIVSNEFENRYRVAKVVIGLLVFLGVAYIAMRFVKSCISPEGKSWRSVLFMAFSSVFIFAVFIIVVSNSLVLFNYEGS